MTGEPVLRTAVPGDGASIARCHIACWREAYAHLVSDEFLEGLDVEERADMWERAIARRGPEVPVADVEGEIVGLAGASPRRDEDEGLPDLELRLIYVRAAYHGTGTGQRLLDAAIGDGPAYVWVAEDNPRAHSFYRRNGFRPDGARKIEPAFEDMAEVRMVRGVDAA